MPTGTTSQPLEHTLTAPNFKEASVVDAMRIGVVSCPSDTPVKEVARIMATYRIHCVVVSEMEDGRPTGVVTDIDLARAAAAGPEQWTAGQLARSEVATRRRPQDAHQPSLALRVSWAARPPALGSGTTERGSTSSGQGARRIS
jgi:predicted transcriptional regulator